nr:MAG TPA_asm: hypothetical protein [Caudoviricetes sp.]
MSEYVLIIFGFLIVIMGIYLICDYIYQHINIKLCGTTDLKIVHIDMYSSNNQYQDIINIEDIDEVEVKIRDGMVLCDACFTVSHNINILTIIEIPTEEMMTDINRYDQSKEMVVICADKKEHKIIIH